MIIECRTLPVVLLAAVLVPCTGLRAQSRAPTAAGPHVVQVVAEDYAFDAPDSVPEGWITFRMQNVGDGHHFALVTRLPEGKSLDDYLVEVATPFDDALRGMRSGELTRTEAGRMIGQSLPGWFAAARRTGGPALLAPGHVSEVTLHLEAGEYFLECYMKTPEGEFHAMEGMIRPFTVAPGPSEGAPPQASEEILLGEDGIRAPEEMTPGRHIIAVRFEAQPETGDSHDLHLARLDGDTQLDDVVPWMEWFDVEGLRDPAPTTFLGGTQEMPAGATAYVTVELEPGRYAWVSQMTAAQGFVRTFTVRSATVER